MIREKVNRLSETQIEFYLRCQCIYFLTLSVTRCLLMFRLVSLLKRISARRSNLIFYSGAHRTRVLIKKEVNSLVIKELYLLK